MTVHITGEWVLDVEASTGVVTWSQVSSRAQWSEQSSSDEDDDVSFAVSNAHLIGPFTVVLDFLYDAITSTATFVVFTGLTATTSSSSRNIGTIFVSIFDFDAYFSTTSLCFSVFVYLFIVISYLLPCFVYFAYYSYTNKWYKRKHRWDTRAVIDCFLR